MTTRPLQGKIVFEGSFLLLHYSTNFPMFMLKRCVAMTIPSAGNLILSFPFYAATERALLTFAETQPRMFTPDESDVSDESGEVGSIKWSSHPNIHKVVQTYSDTGHGDEMFQSSVILTDKIDGSNLGIRVEMRRADSDNGKTEWQVMALQGVYVCEKNKDWPTVVVNKQPISPVVTFRTGRNSALFKGEGGLRCVWKYGNVGSLGALPLAMKSFAVSVALALNVTKIVVYGEAFRAPGDGCTTRCLCRLHTLLLRICPSSTNRCQSGIVASVWIQVA